MRLLTLCQIYSHGSGKGAVRFKGTPPIIVVGAMVNDKPVLFEFPTYEYFVTGEKAGDCAKMN